MALHPIQVSDRLADSVYERLRYAIFAGDLTPGSRLSVPRLAQELTVSRSPVREAVLRLIEEGLATGIPHRGAFVAHVGTSELVELYQVREVLEGLAARLAAERADAELCSTLAESHERHRKAIRENDLAGHLELDMQFHRLMRQGTGNAELTRLLDGTQDKVRLAMITRTASSGRLEALNEHGAILESIRVGDADGAESRARAHVQRLRATLRRSQEPSPRAADSTEPTAMS